MDSSEKPASPSAAFAMPRKRLIQFKLWALRTFLPTDTTWLLLSAALVGAVGGLLAVIFRLLNEDLQSQIFGGQGEGMLSAAQRLQNSWPWLGPLVTGLVPALGGLAAGLILYFGERLTKGAKAPEMLEAVTVRDGKLSLRAAVVKSLSSLVSISTGASIGREGAMVQLGATAASKFGQLRQASPQRLRLLVGCGVASAIAAAYNAPIAAALFVTEIILGNFAMEIFGPVVLSSVVATLISRKVFGLEPVFGHVEFEMKSGWELISYVLLGLLCGVVAPRFRDCLRGSKSLFDKLKWSVPLKLAMGGLIVGATAIFFPAVMGNGYEAASHILSDKMPVLPSWCDPWMWIALALVLKLFATSVSVGSGAAGGVFTPTLFMGAAVGALFAEVVHAVAPFGAAQPGAYALVGMGCLLAGTTHAPLMAILMIFEMTMDYSVILPLMVGCVLSTFMARQLRAESIYTEPLREAGGLWRTAPEAMVMTSIKVSEVMRHEVVSVKDGAAFQEVVDVFFKSRRNNLYVVNQEERFLGAISLHDVKEMLQHRDDLGFIVAHDLLNTGFPVVTPGEPLAQVFEKFWTQDCERLPVVDNVESRRLVGSISKRDILGVYGREILDKDFRLARVAHHSEQGAVSRYLELPSPYVVAEIPIPDSLDSVRLSEIGLTGRFGVLALLVKNTNPDGEETTQVVSAAYSMRRGDRLIALGKPEGMARFQTAAEQGDLRGENQNGKTEREP